MALRSTNDSDEALSISDAVVSFRTNTSDSSWSQRYQSFDSNRLRRETDLSEDEDSHLDLKALFDVLFKNQIPGPRLIRLHSEFTTNLGRGGQGNVYGVGEDFGNHVTLLQQNPNQRLQRSALSWTNCAVKHLRSDQRRDAVKHAYREIKRLCHQSFRDHPNIVKLVGWGISLDSLENPASETSRTPMLILERARCNLSEYIDSRHYDQASYKDLCEICLDIGRGLGAVHNAKVVHGDMKLENILMFYQHSISAPGTPAKIKWIAKLCDFGSAIVEVGSQAKDNEYYGSPLWIPPERYLDIVETPCQESLVPCDIFTYGLIVWAVFVGIPFSPILSMQGGDGEHAAANIVPNIGKQLFYQKASKAVRASYYLTKNERNIVLAELTEHALACFGGQQNHQAIEKRWWLKRRRLKLSGNDEYRLENEINRILIVLRGSLDDNPKRRDLQPWRYLNYERFRSISHVEDPPLFVISQNANVSQTRHFGAWSYEDPQSKGGIGQSFISRIQILLNQPAHLPFHTPIQGPKANLMSTCSVLVSISAHHLKRMFPALQPGSSRQRVYESVIIEASRFLPVGWDLDSMTALEHPPNITCFNLRELFTSYNVADDQPYELFGGFHRLYSLARIRSRLKLCCWKAANLAISYFELGLESAPDLSTLAWLCRGEIGQFELLEMQAHPAIWFRLFVNSKIFSQQRLFKTRAVEILLLLFERGYPLQQEVRVGEASMTLFHWFIHSHAGRAIELCRHFKRVAATDDVTSETRFFLTGQLPHLTVDEITEQELCSTTALHEAVRAQHYLVVEYLVGTDFVVSARDKNKQLALDIATKQNFSSPSLHSIIALLKQHVETKNANLNERGALPIGWEAVEFADGKTVWRETSIESSIDAITFQVPKTGLYQNRRLLLGKIRGQGKDYKLDPIRFMRSRNAGHPRFRPATESHFNDAWYKKDSEITRIPPSDPFLDERAWYRIAARILSFGWSSLRRNYYSTVSLPFIPLTILARCLSWNPNAQLVFSVCSIGPLSLGLSSAVEDMSSKFHTSVSPANMNFLSVIASNSSELLIGLCAVSRAEIRFLESVVIGTILCNLLLALGLCILIGGLRFPEQYFNKTAVGGMTHLNVVASGFSFLLSLPHSIWIGGGTLEKVDEFILRLSHAIAIVSLTLWLLFVLYRYKTHTALFEEEIEDLVVSERTQLVYLSPIQALAVTLACFALLTFCMDTLVQSVLLRTPRFRMTFGMFGIPLIARPWSRLEAAKQAWKNKTDYAIDSNLGSTLYMVLFIFPSLTLIGWVIDVPLTMQFDTMESLAYFFTVWFVAYILQDGKSRYIDGGLLIGVYIMLALAFGIYYNSDSFS